MLRTQHLQMPGLTLVGGFLLSFILRKQQGGCCTRTSSLYARCLPHPLPTPGKPTPHQRLLQAPGLETPVHWVPEEVLSPSFCSIYASFGMQHGNKQHFTSLLDLLTPWCFRIYFCFLFPFTDAISCLVWGLMFTIKHGMRGLKTGRAHGRAGGGGEPAVGVGARALPCLVWITVFEDVNWLDILQGGSSWNSIDF